MHARKERIEKGGGGKSEYREHIFALVDDENDTEFSNSSLTHAYTYTHTDELSKFRITSGAKRGRLRYIRVVWRVTRHLVTRILNPG